MVLVSQASATAPDSRGTPPRRPLLLLGCRCAGLSCTRAMRVLGLCCQVLSALRSPASFLPGWTLSPKTSSPANRAPVPWGPGRGVGPEPPWPLPMWLCAAGIRSHSSAPWHLLCAPHPAFAFHPSSCSCSLCPALGLVSFFSCPLLCGRVFKNLEFSLCPAAFLQVFLTYVSHGSVCCFYTIPRAAQDLLE